VTAPAIIARLCDELAAAECKARLEHQDAADAEAKLDVMKDCAFERDAARAELAEVATLYRMADNRERMLERELMAIWAIVCPGEPLPPGEDHVRHAVENMAARVRR